MMTPKRQRKWLEMPGADMEPDSKSRLKEWLASGEVRLHPLSFSQRELWEASAVPVEHVSNHICTFMEVKGHVTHEDCLAALQMVVDRHEVLRISILPGKEAPLQLIRKSAKPAIQFSGMNPDREDLNARMRPVFETPFNYLRGPLYRVEVIRRGPDDMVLVLAIHHAIADGWSLGVFVEDLCSAYLQLKLGMGSALPEVAMTYSGWATGEQAYWTPAKLEETGRYWGKRLSGAPRIWKSLGESNDWEMAREASFVPAESTQAIKDLAKKCDATLFSTLLTVFQQALYQWTGVNDFVIGVPYANRSKHSVRGTMGYCSGNVPIRGHVDPSRPMAACVEETHREALDSFAHAMPFAELSRAVGEPRVPGQNPVFDVRFALQNHPIPDVVTPGLSVQLRMRSTGTARFELGCEITEAGNELEVIWVYRKKRFTPAGIKEMDGIFLTALEEIRHSRSQPAVVLCK